MSHSNPKKPVPLNQAAFDLWDDTLLIKKYDESLMLAKEEVAKRIAQSTNTDDNVADSEAAEATTPPTTGPPQVGDCVRCTFSEDGIDYEAEIVSIRGESCLIRYVGYNNEETVDIGALIPSWGAEVRDEQIRASGTTDTATTVASTAPQMDEEKACGGALKTKKTKHNKQQKTFDRVRASMLIPPPPPLPPMQGDDDGDSEHLSSMLMAWYMSGYYTGLYQGQKMAKQSKKE